MKSSVKPVALRDYQNAAIQGVYSHWKAGLFRVMLQLPTGGGKTVIFSFIIHDFISRFLRVLVLVHKDELIWQAKQKLEEITGLKLGVIKAGHPVDIACQIQVASVQTLHKRKHLIGGFDLVVVDEAHHCTARTYTEILELLPEAYVLGVSATPERLDGQGFAHIFDAIVLGPQVSWLMEAGHLSPYKLYAATQEISVKGVATVAGDFNPNQLKRAALSADIMGAIIPTWRTYADGLQTVVFCIDREHARDVCDLFSTARINAAYLDGKTPTEERREILQQFAAGIITVLVNCGIVSEGLDIPGIQAVQILRPTKSLALYLQQLGRALRPAPGKTAIIIDHTSNWKTHGLPCEERIWSLTDQPKRKTKHLERSEDGEVRERQEREIIHDASVKLVEIRLKADPQLIAKLHELHKVQQVNGYNPLWILYQLIELPGVGLAELRELAKLLGYEPGWAWQRWQEIQTGTLGSVGGEALLQGNLRVP
ncbi:MAG: DEAD/DEAH box helicase [Leptolyngbyaceae bacterium]|nr:DEAD/DEAH box helicase [Leptolyngbyaceae bacterium]